MAELDLVTAVDGQRESRYGLVDAQRRLNLAALFNPKYVVACGFVFLQVHPIFDLLGRALQSLDFASL